MAKRPKLELGGAYLDAKRARRRIVRKSGGRSRARPLVLVMAAPVRGRKPKGVPVGPGHSFTTNHWNATGAVTVSVYNKSKGDWVYVR
jgi:hypothetical protein